MTILVNLSHNDNEHKALYFVPLICESVDEIGQAKILARGIHNIISNYPPNKTHTVN
jgi:hypothetical protein